MYRSVQIYYMKIGYKLLKCSCTNNYFRAHKKTRSIVERGIGQLKRRFHVLHGEVRLAPEKTCKMINVCAVLHNICKTRGIPVPDDADNPLEDVAVPIQQGDQVHAHPALPVARNGHPFRDYIANLHFK